MPYELFQYISYDIPVLGDISLNEISKDYSIVINKESTSISVIDLDSIAGLVYG